MYTVYIPVPCMPKWPPLDVGCKKKTTARCSNTPASPQQQSVLLPIVSAHLYNMVKVVMVEEQCKEEL